MAGIPTGTVTFLFTDIEGSTKLAREHPETWETARSRHHAILREAIECHHGYVFQIIGDAFCAAFHTAGEALRAAVKSQVDLHAENWGDVLIKVRMGIHSGTAQFQEEGQYTGYTTLAATQRIMSAGHGGQVLLSEATRSLVRDILPESASLLDMGEKRLKDLLRPERLYQLGASGLPVNFPPLKTLDAFPNNLPVQLTTFIGREQEIAEVKQELAEHRLVTLTGSGGTGKTRLSLQVAADLLEKFDHGVWFVELASITNPDLIPQTILSAAEMQTQQGRSVLDSLKDFLREKTSLLVLDNCEHLIEACAKLTDTLLRIAPNLKILASSREALEVQGEQACQVPSLSIPDLNHLPPLEQLSQYEAVRLFIDRALLVQPHFAMTNDNAPAVAQICSHLDGIPLAIELAAARVKVLKAEQIAERLNDRFRLLTSGSRTALPRQQTLRALVDWSYDLLSENEKLLLRRLSLFRGGWTLEAAEQVCSDDQILEDEVLGLLTPLVDKSLVVIDEQPHQLRYRMLETVHLYAREKLFESGEGEKLRTLHLAYFLKFAEEAEPHLVCVEQVEWLDRLEWDHDNFRAALEWAKVSSRTKEGLRMAIGLWKYWYLHSYVDEGYEWLIETMQQDEKLALSLELRAKALYRTAHLAFFKGEIQDHIKTLLEESRVLNQKLSDNDGYAFTLLLMAWLYEPEEGMKLYKRALEHAQRTGSSWLIAGIYLNMANTAIALGDNEQFILYLDECISLYRKLGDRWGLAYSLWNRAISNRLLGNYDAAESLLSESLSYFTELGHKAGARTILLEQANLAFLQRNYEQASILCEKILALAREIGNRNDELTALWRLGHVARLEGDHNKARSLLLEALTAAKEINNQELIVHCIEEFAVLGVVQGQAKRSATLFGATELPRKTIHQVLLPIETIEVDQNISAARAQLDDATFNAAYTQGRSMTIEQTITYALEETR